MIYNFVPGMASLNTRISAGIGCFDLGITGESDAGLSIRREKTDIQLVREGDMIGKKRQPDKVVFTMDKSALNTYASFLDDTGYDDHKDVKTDTTWKNIYDIKARDLPHKSGATISTKSVLSAPCLRCGFIFPIDNITVDHQRPQSGGSFTAILKVFRTMKLTMEDGRGFKGKHIFDLMMNGKALGSTKRTTLNHVSGTGLRGRRYELSYEGVLVYSVMRAITSKSILMQACMHNACNLAPLCAICNSSKNNVWDY